MVACVPSGICCTVVGVYCDLPALPVAVEGKTTACNAAAVTVIDYFMTTATLTYRCLCTLFRHLPQAGRLFFSDATGRAWRGWAATAWAGVKNCR